MNNAAYLDYLQEARVAFLLSAPPALHQLLDSGALVVSHRLEYLRPIIFSERPLTINLWVDAIGGSRISHRLRAIRWRRPGCSRPDRGSAI